MFINIEKLQFHQHRNYVLLLENFEILLIVSADLQFLTSRDGDFWLFLIIVD